MRANASIRPAAAGMTLLEIMIALALIGSIMALGVRGFRSLARSDLRATSSKLAGAIRYLFDRASTTGRTHRLVIDIEKGTYFAEVTDERVFMPRERENEETRAREAEELAAEEAAAKEAAEGNSDVDPYDISRYQPKEFVPKRAKFEGFKDTALKPVEIKGAIIASFFTPRLAEPVSSGRAYLYFFPLGQTEPALIHVSDKARETYYTLIVHPLTGRVQIHNGYLEPRVEEQFDDEGQVLER